MNKSKDRKVNTFSVNKGQKSNVRGNAYRNDRKRNPTWVNRIDQLPLKQRVQYVKANLEAKRYFHIYKESEGIRLPYLAGSLIIASLVWGILCSI